MPWMPTPARGLAALALTLALAVAGCGDDADSDRTAGTGSSGGNPSQVTFALGQSPIGARWDVAILQLDRAEVFRFDADGDCVAVPEATVEVDADLSLNLDRLDALDLGAWCRVRVVPRDGEALVRLVGATRLGPFDVSLFRGGLDLDVIDAEGAQSPALVVRVEPARVIGALDLSSLPEVDGVRIVDDADATIADVVSPVLAETIVVYADPTPDVPGLTLAERDAATPVAVGVYAAP